MAKELMSGNEAVARGACEAGVSFASAYPGTPSTEILENIGEKYSDRIICEWAPNEKVAFEAAVGASIIGGRSMAAMKHVGLNVAADPMCTFAYTGVNGGMFFVSADDPGMHSSQNEQDNRYYARFAKIAMLEPSDSQECKDMVKTALEISERFDTPVMLRMTTRVCHSKSLVEFGEPVEQVKREYVKNRTKFDPVPAMAKIMHSMVEKRWKALGEFADECALTREIWNGRDIGIISSGAAFNYAVEVFGDRASYLKLGFTCPLPMGKIKEFAGKVKKLYVVEELEPYMEDQLRAAGIEDDAFEADALLRIVTGRGHLEQDPETPLTAAQSARLEALGLHYFGVGVSGGEEGARRGPSIMPGGDRAAYELVRPILEAIAARAEDGAPCCAYIGPDGAGHYVKMVHNGIEYADMQLIAEAYLLLRETAGFSNAELAELFREWNKGELKSYLIGITASIFAEADDLAPGALVDVIEDSAQQKGTGRWASIEALRQGAHLSMITEACNARILSNLLDERAAASRVVEAPAVEKAADKDKFAEEVRRGLYTAKIAAYAQGMRLLRDASEAYGWKLELGRIAAIFRAGCIIQAAFLDDITRAFERDARLSNLMMDPFFAQGVNAGQGALRRCAAQGILSGIPLPVFTAACAYLDGWRGAPVGANLIQAQRDLFGAHTYRRTDREGVFHHEWRRDNG